MSKHKYMAKVKDTYFFSTLILLLFSQLVSGQNIDYTQFVNPNIGCVHSRWFFYTPGALPFGMAKPGPVTNAHYGNREGWEAIGYDDRHTSIEGFAQLHEFQVGGIVTMASSGKLVTVPGDIDKNTIGYRSDFRKATEIAHAGYYSVVLDKYKIKAELTATQRVGYIRFTFPKSDSSHILFDIGNRQGESGEIKDSYVNILSNNEVEGWVVTNPEYVKKYQSGATVSMFFVAQLSKSAKSSGVFTGEKQMPGIKSISGKGAGLFLNFNTNENESIEIKIGLSYTSIENARLNLQAEASGKNFATAVREAKKIWNQYLGKVQVKGKSIEDKTKFYTGLYHALLGRGLASDINGAYPSNNGVTQFIQSDVSGKPVHQHYNTDAIWGGYWNLTQLWGISYPDYYSEFVKSQLLVYKDCGWLGDGIANSKFVSGVGTNYTGLAIASAYNYGIRDFDVQLGYEAARKNELEWQNRPEGAGKADLKGFIELGYVPYVDKPYYTGQEGSAFSASHSLEYCFSSYAVAVFAKSLGKSDDYQKLMKNSKGWQLLYDHSNQFIRPKYRNGEFIENFNPLESWRGFQEGNAWQYTFYVPQDPKGLVSLIGQKQFNNRLDSIFVVTQKSGWGSSKNIDAFSGVTNLYNHGNQPNLHISWLFNFSGKPWLTQKWTRAICNEFYGSTALHGYGYGQDEDQGQLGAWYVMASIGLFDVQGGTSEKPTFQIGSPLFDQIKLKLNTKNASGKEFIIDVVNNNKKNIYIQKAFLNGKPLKSNWIYMEDILKGGNLKLIMGPEPNTSWGITNASSNSPINLN